MKLDTKHKIKIASIAFKTISLGRRIFGKNDRVSVRRGKLNWNLDLQEGIDLSIYLLGGFEPGTLRLYKKLLENKAGIVIFDVGANIGAHTLPLAKLVVPHGGKVYAFEPTCYAYDKLVNNIKLNPELSHGIETVQAMLVAQDGDVVDGNIYSSWPLANGKELHHQHLGELKSTNGAEAFTLDYFVMKNSISKIDFIKLDVDGHESDVLAGAYKALKSFKPAILMEWSPSLFTGDNMKKTLSMLLKTGYLLYDGSTGKEIHGGYEELNGITPLMGSINIMLRFP